MKASFTLIISLFMLCQVFAQSKWAWGVQTEIGLSGAHRTSSTTNESRSTVFESTKFFRNSAAIGGGLWVQYQLKDRLGLRSGLQYMNVGESNGRTSTTKLISTQQQTSYYSTSNVFRVHRLQLPFLVTYEIGNTSIKPTIGIGGIWSQDMIKDLRQRQFDTNSKLYSSNAPLGFPAVLKTGGIQATLSIGMQLNAALSLEFRHLFGKTKTIGWTVDPFGDHNSEPMPPDVIICFVGPYRETIETRYHQSSSLIIRYGF